MPPKSLQKRKQGEDTQKNSMPFALVGCVQKKKPPAKVSDASQKPPKEKAGRGYPKKQHAIRLSRMRPKKKNHLLRWVMPAKRLQKRKQGEDTQKKTACHSP